MPEVNQRSGGRYSTRSRTRVPPSTASNRCSWRHSRYGPRICRSTKNVGGITAIDPRRPGQRRKTQTHRVLRSATRLRFRVRTASCGNARLASCIYIAMTQRNALLIGLSMVLLLSLLARIPAAQPVADVASGAATPYDVAVDRHAINLLVKGRQIFRFDAFGD